VPGVAGWPRDIVVGLRFRIAKTRQASNGVQVVIGDEPFRGPPHALIQARPQEGQGIVGTFQPGREARLPVGKKREPPEVVFLPLPCDAEALVESTSAVGLEDPGPGLREVILVGHTTTLRGRRIGTD